MLTMKTRCRPVVLLWLGLSGLLLLMPEPSAAQGVYLTNRGFPSRLYELDLTANEAIFLRVLESDTQVFAMAMCPGDETLLTIGRNLGMVARVDLSTTPPAETILGQLPGDLRVVQMACSPEGTIFFTDNPTDQLYTLDLSTCDPTLTTPCSPELMGTVETALGAADVNILGADISLTGTGKLYLIAIGPGGPADRKLYEVDVSALPCPDSSCPASFINDFSTGDNVPGLTALDDRRLIISSNEDHLYRIDPTDASLTDLGTLVEFPSGDPIDIRNGDLAAIWSTCPAALDFEMDGNGDPLVPGQIIDDEFAALGITVATNDPVNHPLMIFDSGAPIGDEDLGTPNSDFGGPGIGLGGGADRPGRNGLPRGQVLVVSEDANPAVPNDHDGGGVIDFIFDPPMPLVTEIHILDIDDQGAGTIKAFDSDGMELVSRPLLPLGNNSFQVVPVGAFEVGRLEVTFPSSGAVSAVIFCTDCGANFEGESEPEPSWKRR